MSGNRHEPGDCADAQVDDPEITRIANRVIREGFDHGASDIIVESLEKSVRVSYLVNRREVMAPRMPGWIAEPLVARLRRMACLPTRGDGFGAEGEMTVRVGGRVYHLMVFTAPTVFGERIVIRIPI